MHFPYAPCCNVHTYAIKGPEVADCGLLVGIFPLMHEEMAVAMSNAAVRRKACLNLCHLAYSGRGWQKWQTVVKESCVQVAGFSMFKVKVLVMGTPFWEQNFGVH